jgi:predicted nucleotide-binding protein
MPYDVTLLVRLDPEMERLPRALGSGRADGGIELMTKEKFNLDEVTLERQFLRPFREGRDIILDGSRIPLSQIFKWHILYSDPLTPGSRKGKPKKVDVTDEVLNRDPGADRTASSSESASEVPSASSHSSDPRSVFLVHGRWNEAVEAMREFLSSLDLRAIEWEQAVQATGKASPYIGEILDAGFKMAHVALVLMTPDDLACLHPSLRSPNTEPEPLTGQPRPNVIFEGGMAWQQFRNRTLLVEFGHLRGFSDLNGVHVLRLDGSPQTRRAIASRLKTIGCAVDDSGTRWLSAGDFPPELSNPSAVDLGFEVGEKVEARGVVTPSNALRGIPLRWILMARLAEMYREQTSSDSILTLDVQGIAEQAGVELSIVKAVISELLGEGLAEGFAETFGHSAIDGACRITPEGLRRIRAEA